MKTYLLIFFILLFYSIKSVTIEECRSYYDQCCGYCQHYKRITDLQNCRGFCFSKLGECANRSRTPKK